jgi:hypothetical protein
MKNRQTTPRLLAILLAAVGLFFVSNTRAQKPPAPSPETALSEALAAACRQDTPAFSSFLTSDNAAAFSSLSQPQRTALMKRFVLLEDPGKPMLSSSAEGRPVVRCEAPGITTEMRFGKVRTKENLSFIPLAIPIPGEAPRSITFGLVLESGNWKLLSAGLLLLDIPSMAMQWEQADLEGREDNAIAVLRKLAAALETYRSAYGKLPESLALLGPAEKGGISPETAGLLDSEIAAGHQGGYTFRYTIVPAEGNLPEEDANKAARFSLAASPDEYNKVGRRSFFLDSTGVLRGADKQGMVATSADPRIGVPQDR